jgi:hypothetical protein
MNKVVFSFALAALALGLSAAAAPAGDGCAAPCEPCAVPCATCAPDKVFLHVEIDEHPYKVETTVKTRKLDAIVRKDSDKEVPCTRMVPVQVCDPCTGCVHTEWRCETVLQKVKSTTLDIAGPNPEECTTKTEEKVAQTIRICIEHRPAPCPTPAPPPAK